MILTGDEIQKEMAADEIEISPFDAGQINPASYDLRLGEEVRVYERFVTHLGRGDLLAPAGFSSVIDVKGPAEPTLAYKIGRNGWLLRPGIGYLMHTQETVWSRKYVSVVDGKSSLGRLFISVHTTAGYIDPGFRGQITLEVTVTHAVRVYAGMRFAQIRFHALQGQNSQYVGRYRDATARGAVPPDLSGLEA